MGAKSWCAGHGLHGRIPVFFVVWLLAGVLSSCTTQQSVLYVPTKEVDVQSMELGDVQRWPERMVTMTGRMTPCP